ncbi:MAG: DUF1036 domain-containing protein [Pseudomonadota bacterium]
MRLITLFVTTLLAAFLLQVGDADAKYTLCNKTSFALSASIGYVDGDQIVTEGWRPLRPGQCNVVLTKQTEKNRVYIYAEGVPGHKGPLKIWSGDTYLCVKNGEGFSIRNPGVCRDDPRNRRRFKGVDVPEELTGVFQIDFTEPSNFTKYTAEVAGVQRLLGDVGKSAGSIDGTWGKATRQRIADYRKEKNLPAGTNITEDLIDALVADANAAEAKLGFFFCNKADGVVWGAIAEPEKGDKYLSKGWYKLEPGACAKVIKGELAADHYYVYGVMETPSGGDLILDDGDRALCVNDVLFEVDSAKACAENDLDEALFRRVDIGGAPTATFDFKPDNFSAPPTKTSQKADK